MQKFFAGGGDRYFLIGPEGGFTAAEVAAAEAHGRAALLWEQGYLRIGRRHWHCWPPRVCAARATKNGGEFTTRGNGFGQGEIHFPAEVVEAHGAFSSRRITTGEAIATRSHRCGSARSWTVQRVAQRQLGRIGLDETAVGVIFAHRADQGVHVVVTTTATSMGKRSLKRRSLLLLCASPGLQAVALISVDFRFGVYDRFSKQHPTTGLRRSLWLFLKAY